MSRNIFIQAHLLVAALFAPVILLMAISGGLYLLGVKGHVEQTELTTPPGVGINLESSTLQEDVGQLIAKIDPDHTFEYLKVKGDTLFTRPTSKIHYELKVADQGVSIFRNEPSLQNAMVELHKGHGPRAYKTLQKVMAGGLIFVLISGMWLGLSSRILRVKTLTTLAIGAVIAAALALL